MVAFHNQRLKDSICREFWQNLNVKAEENSSHVCLRNLKLEWQSVFAINYHSQLGIPDLPFFDFLDNDRVFMLSELNRRLVIVDLPTPD